MVRISEYNEFGEKFVFEPPVEVNDHIVDSLGKLAAIAAKGADSDVQTIDELTIEVNRVAGLLHESGGIEAVNRYLTNVASRKRARAVFTSRY